MDCDARRCSTSPMLLDDVRNHLIGAQELPVTTLDHHYSALTSISDCNYPRLHSR